MGRALRRLIVLGLVAAAIAALSRGRRARAEVRAAVPPHPHRMAPTMRVMEPPAPVAPAPVAAPPPPPVEEMAAAPEPTWVVPADGQCPESHPVKANDNSGIYHVPGGMHYARTRAERCYDCEASAEADGYRAAKR